MEDKQKINRKGNHMDIDNPDAKCMEINPDDYKIRIKISPERVELRKQIYASVARVAIAFYHIDYYTPSDFKTLGEQMIKNLDEIYERIEKMDEAERRTTWS